MSVPKGPVCPFMRLSRCLGARCELYNEDARGCALGPLSLQLLLRTALTDAAVEILREYRLREVDDGK